MDIERLKELKDYLRVANELSILNDDNLMQRIVDNNDVANTIDIAIELLNAEIARQSVTDDAVRDCSTCIGCDCKPELGETVKDCKAYVRREPSDADVAEAIEDFEKIKSNYMRTAKAFDGSRDPMYEESCKNIDRYALAITALRQYQKPTDEKIRQAIEWQSCLKDHHQHEWEGTDIDWQMEPGAQAEHDEMMQAFDLAIQALRQMRTEPDCSTAEWQGGYCLGYGKSDTDDEPCEVCKACPKQASYDDDKCELIVYHGENWLVKEYRIYRCSNCQKATAVRSNFCPSCGGRMVK